MSFKTVTNVYVFCLMLSVFGACKVSNDDAPVAPINAQLNVVHLIPGTGSINYYSDGTRQNNYKLGYALSSGYLAIPTQQIAYVKDTLYNILYSATLTLLHTQKYTVLATGQQANNSVAGILLIDTSSTLAAKARVRFINASPNAPALDAYFNKITISSKAYKSASGFTTVDTGSVVLNLKLAGTTPVVYTKTLKFSAAGVYTVYAYGLLNASGTTAFTTGIITNQ